MNKLFFFNVLMTLFFVTKQEALTQEMFTHIDIKDHVNMGFYDETEGDGKGGWTDFGKSACLHYISSGKQVFQDGIIPFMIIDPADNNDKSVIVLNGPNRENHFRDHSGKIIVNKKCAAMFFLHTTMYAENGDDSTLVDYRVHYQDNTEIVFHCRKGKEIDDWWEPSEFMKNSIRTYGEEKKWVINTPWRNPFPEKRIEWIRMESTGNAIPILLGITCSKQPDPYHDLVTKIRERREQYENSFLTVAMLQIRSHPNQEWNLQKGEDYCRIARKKDADIAVFPEMYNIGYNSIDFSQSNSIERWKRKAVPRDGKFVGHFKNLANELNMAILISYLEYMGDNELPRNSASLIDRHGNIVMTYAKVHTCDFFHHENATTPGDGFYVSELDTESGMVKVGIMICYDREAPESARVLMLKGAELILTPNACELDELRINQFQSRAFENAVVTAMANYAYSEENEGYNGRSCLFNVDGEEVLMAGKEEGVYTTTFNLHDIRNYRKETVWGNAFRRPDRYHILISPEIEEPWPRKDSFGNTFERK